MATPQRTTAILYVPATPCLHFSFYHAIILTHHQTKITYSCICEDGSTPDLAKYKNTLPEFVCQANFAGCIDAHPNDAVGQGKCKTDIQDTCGTLNITDYKSGSSSGSSSGTASETASPSSTGGSGSSSGATGTTGSTPSSTSGSGSAAATSDSAAVALTGGMDIGAGVLAAGLLGLFGYML